MDFMKHLLLLMVLSSWTIDASFYSWLKNRKAVQLYKGQMYDESLAIYNNLIDQDPYNSTYNYNIGDVLYRQGRYEDAFQAFTRAGMHAKNNQNIAEYAWYGAGNSSYQLKKWQQAVDMYEKALAINPDNEQTLHNLRLAQLLLVQEQAEQMQDEDKKDQEKDKHNKKDKNEDSGKDQQDSQDQENQDGENSQNSSGSSKDQSSGDDKDGQQGQSGQEKKQSKQGLGNKKDVDSGKDQDNQKDFDQDVDKSSHEKSEIGKPGADTSGSKQDGKKSEKADEQSGVSKDDIPALDEKNEASQSDDGYDASKVEKKLDAVQKKLDDAQSQVDKQEYKSAQDDEHNESEEQSDHSDESIQRAASTSLDVKNEKESDGDQQDNKKVLIPAYKKQELKDELKDSYEAKGSQDERLEDHFSKIIEMLEKQEDQIQRYVIKNRVAEKMVGQHGKNGW